MILKMSQTLNPFQRRTHEAMPISARDNHDDYDFTVFDDTKPD